MTLEWAWELVRHFRNNGTLSNSSVDALATLAAARLGELQKIGIRLDDGFTIAHLQPMFEKRQGLFTQQPVHRDACAITQVVHVLLEHIALPRRQRDDGIPCARKRGSAGSM